MPSPLIENMMQQHGYPELDHETLDPFLQQHDECVLFFTEDPARFPESNDVAMILPELVKTFDDRFVAAVIAPASQRRLQTRFGFNEWPSLVFLREGGFLGTISRVQDWAVYLQQVQQILARQPKSAPGFAVPVEQAGSACDSCGGQA